MIKISLTAATLLWVIALLEMTNFSRVITSPAILFCLDARYLNILVFVAVLVHILNILTHSRSFSGFLWSYLIGVRVAKGADVVSTCTKDTFCVGNASVIVTCIRFAGVRNECVRDAHIRDVDTIRNC